LLEFRASDPSENTQRGNPSDEINVKTPFYRSWYFGDLKG
jgi:hypothetical protein